MAHTQIPKTLTTVNVFSYGPPTLLPSVYHELAPCGPPEGVSQFHMDNAHEWSLLYLEPYLSGEREL